MAQARKCTIKSHRHAERFECTNAEIQDLRSRDAAMQCCRELGAEMQG